MRFLLDESVDLRLAAFLRNLGHDATSIVEDHPRALADHAVLALARREGRILLTNDRGFGDLIVRQRLPHGGVVVFRLKSEALETKQRRLAGVIATHARDLNQFVIVAERHIRVRRTAP